MARNSRILAVVLVVQIAIGLSYAVLTPPWQGHEQDYYNVTRFLVTEHRLPTPADYPNGDAEIRQATQPPLYFLLAAPVVALFDNGLALPYGVPPIPLCPGGEQVNAVIVHYVTNQAYDDPFQGTLAAGYFLRFLNVLLGAVAVFFTYKAGLVLFPERQTVALIGAALLAFEPATLQFVPVLSNDTLLLAVCAALLYVDARILTQAQLSRRDVFLLIVLSIAAPLVKLPGWAALLASLLVLAYRLIFRSRGSRFLLLSLGLIVLLSLGIGWFNYQHYGSVLGRYSILDRAFVAFAQRLDIPWVVFSGVVDATHNELLGPLNLLHPRAAFVSAYNLLLLACLVAILIGLVWALVKRQSSQLRAYGLLILLAGITCAVVLLRNSLTATVENTTAYNLAEIFAPVRYYVPALPPLALLIAAGLGVLAPRLTRGLLGVVPALGFGVVSLAVTLMLLTTLPPDARIDLAALAAMPGIQHVDLQASADAPRIVGYSLQEQPTAGWLDLTLYLSLDKASETNFLAQAALTSGQSTPFPCEFLPARGIYPTPRWAAGQVIATQARIPNCGADLPVGANLTVRWVGYSLSGDVLETTPPVTITQLDQPLAADKDCPPNLGVIAGRFQLVKWNSPPTVQANEVYLPSVNWLILSSSSAPVRRVFLFTHDQTQYSCVGSPSEETLPVQSWERGQTIYFDQCEQRFPIDAPKGVYAVSVGMQTQDGQLLPAVGADGQPTTWLPAGQVELK